jgi:hypothetical protein
LKKDAKDDVKITISDILGEEIASLKGPGKAGLHSIPWQPRGRRIQAADYRVTLTVDGKDTLTALKIEDLVASSDIKEGIGLPLTREDDDHPGGGGR